MSLFSTRRILVTVVISAALLPPVAGAASKPSRPAGTQIISVKATPIALQRGNGALSQTKLNTVTASSGLGFAVKLRNAANVGASGLLVSVSISRAGGSIVIQRMVPRLGPKQTKTLTFRNLGAVPFASRTEMTVGLARGATKVYPVIFALPSGNNPGLAPRARGFAYTVPVVVGLPEEQAITLLQARGLDVLVVQAFSHRPVGHVVAQAPGGGARLSAGSVVKILVSKR